MVAKTKKISLGNSMLNHPGHVTLTSQIFLKFLPVQPWESAVAFGNVIVNAVLGWFYDGKKMLS